MAEVSILAALRKLEGSTIAKRDTGLQDLKRIFSLARGNSKLDPLGDAGFLQVFEFLFGIIRTEKSKYLNAATQTAQNTSESKLSTYAAAFRLVADAASTRIRHKTVIQVLDHIIDTLSVKNSSPLAPIRNDYLKSFRGLLQSFSLLEHLKLEVWENLVDFVLNGLSQCMINDDSHSNGTTSRDVSVDGRTESRVSMRFSQASRGRANRSEENSYIEEFSISLQLLTATSTPAMVRKAHSIIDTCLSYLEVVDRSQDSILGTLNNVFPSLLTHDIALARKLIYQAIPIFRRLWLTKHGGLREQILGLLMTAKSLLSSLIQDGVSHSDSALIMGLFDAILNEYEQRAEKDFLHIDDVYFPEQTERLPLRTLSLAPLRDSTRALAHWATVETLAVLVNNLHERHKISVPSATTTGLSKRRKTEVPFEELMRCARSSASKRRLCAIQIFVFAMDLSDSAANYVSQHASELGRGLSSDDDGISNWSMLLLSRFAFAPEANSAKFQDLWPQWCTLVARNTVSQMLSRSACHFLNSVMCAGLNSTNLSPSLIFDAMFANGSQGPCQLTDSALSLLCNGLVSNSQTNVEGFQNLSFKIIGWLNTYWVLPATIDRLHNASMARYSREDSLYKLLTACMNILTSLRMQDFSIITSLIYSRCSNFVEAIPVSSYLLQLDEVKNELLKSQNTGPSRITIDVSTKARLEHAICDLLHTKLKSFRETWNILQEGKSSNISTDIIQILSSACTVALAVNATMDSSKEALRTEILSSAETIWSNLCGFVSSLDGEFRDRCLLLMSSSLIRIDPEWIDERMLIITQQANFTSPVLNLLQLNFSELESQDELDDDLIDSQASFPTQHSQGSIISRHGAVARQKIPYATDMHTALIQMTCRVLIRQSQGSFGEVGDSRLATAVIDFAASLKPSDMVAARDPLTSFFVDGPSISRIDTSRLLKRLGEACLQEPEFERCEASLCFCVDVLASLAPIWTNGEDDLTSDACDIYGWYLDTVVEKGIATEQTMLSIARMLTAVSVSDPSFGSDMSLLSPRTSLLRLLKAGSAVVQFNIADLICRIFDSFVLSEHGVIFDDIVASLPADPDQEEGIAIRLYLLGILASRWHTLLRKAIYSMFETAARVVAVTPYAQKCFEKISKSLTLRGPQELFVLFSPQLLYTWLESESLNSIPFRAFGYKDLLNLFQDIKQEAIGQIAMRASVSHTDELVQLMETDWKQLLYDGFTVAESYCIARDISTPHNTQFQASEAILRKQLTNDVYLKLMQENFPLIIARLFVITSDDNGIDKALSKRKSLGTAHAALDDICNRSQSQNSLPRGQQPSFRSKYIVDEVEYVCKRVNRDPSTIWEPSLVVYVCRLLFDSANPALGPLHSCAVIRKVRTVVCLAGSQALKGYPLEMLLYALRPFLTEFHCSEDALGLFWYLLDHGKIYLESRGSFFACLVVATFTTISTFLESSQDSTTQESHFSSTMSKIQSFQSWMVKYLESFNPQDMSPDVSQTFNNLTRLASRINGHTTTASGGVQGDLIYLLLNDQHAKDRLLTPTAFFQVMQLLCASFTLSPDPKEDILYLDKDAIRLAPVLMRLLNKVKTPSFDVWVAQVLGRAYASKGSIDGVVSEEMIIDGGLNVPSEPSLQQSYAKIVEVLVTMLRKDGYLETGMAERALQLIFTTLSEQERSIYFSAIIERPIVDDLAWKWFPCPQFQHGPDVLAQMRAPLSYQHDQNSQVWASNLAIAICGRNQSDPVLAVLPSVLAAVPDLAVAMIPSIVHIGLLAENNNQQSIREALSTVIGEVLADQESTSNSSHVKIAIDIVLYLRHQPLPRESTMADRNEWIEVNFTEAAAAASRCDLPKTALLFLELSASQQELQLTRSSRRSSSSNLNVSLELIHNIFYSLDDPDFLFGVQEDASLQSVLTKLTREDAEYKALSFQSALFDSSCKDVGTEGFNIKESDIVGALSRSNFNGIARAVQLQSIPNKGAQSEGVLQVSMNLSHWDLPYSADHQPLAGVVMDTFRRLESFSSILALIDGLDNNLKTLMSPLSQKSLPFDLLQPNFSALAILTELRDLLTAVNSDGVKEELRRQTSRVHWEAQERFDLISPIMLGREATTTAIKRSDPLRSHFKLSLDEARLLEIKTVRSSLKVARTYSAAQFCLNRAMYLSRLAQGADVSPQNVQAAILHDTAHVLWDQGEASASIQILRQLKERSDLDQQAIVVSKAEVLADLGQHTAEARLSKPDDIIAKCLIPAIKELHGKSEGSDAGRVFHNFAVFCDMQLQNPENSAEFSRVETLRQTKMEEVERLAEMVRSAESKRKIMLKKHYIQAEQWYKLDDEEYQRLREIREKFIAQSLENYLRSMIASDQYPNDTLRFVALWLDKSEQHFANAAVEKYLGEVSSRKFAPLMNQLFSRILDEESPFQRLLFGLLYRVCCDHPHHSLYQLFAAVRSRGAKTDPIASSRHSASTRLAEKVMNTKQGKTGHLWVSLHNCSVAFVRLANEKLGDQKVRSGSRLPMRNIESGRKLEQAAHDSSVKIPPPTMRITLRPDCDYSSIPTILRFDPEISIAGGASAPKIVTILATDGSSHKMLLKGGNDDLRQDSIMEQVFEQVSNLLKDHRTTRQRKLGIRTYKVLPLTTNAGIIEFVKNTIPIHEFLLPAHQKYFPKDWKPNKCRKEISDAQSKALAQRILAYRMVCANFRPVMRFFFMERFLEPDEWFQRRLSFSRSVAATSILGHVLGLGDRHGHNILLDEKTGEVVHIDLGVAFEAGRILPIPENVPFRLTRDLVDGMGISGVEGVFRRCCNFTLEALRQDQYSIMTVLDVLRYDPLYSWSMTPLRLQKMQEAQEAAQDTTVDNVTQSRQSSTTMATTTTTRGGLRPGVLETKKSNANEASEADRALTIVAKKLGKSLSVEATVNELIQQATDEKNLATLYCGWAAYA